MRARAETTPQLRDRRLNGLDEVTRLWHRSHGLIIAGKIQYMGKWLWPELPFFLLLALATLLGCKYRSNSLVVQKRITVKVVALKAISTSYGEVDGEHDKWS